MEQYSWGDYADMTAVYEEAQYHTGLFAKNDSYDNL